MQVSGVQLIGLKIEKKFYKDFINKFRIKGIKDSEGMFFTGHQSKNGYNCYKRQDRLLNKQIAESLCHVSMETKKEKTIKQDLKKKRSNSKEKKIESVEETSNENRNFNDFMGNIKLINCSNINFNFYNQRK
ncbi:hypothetical protein M0812_27141 [Anaeramoeba flamelloides]|uniref:Homing endonuclease LAGLIDADG domain-containing protein n=1 Tax=Anaeramoeba flamelloides TaxID=1746091 RepID=A0AAV7YD77_9EUKA|nr:hypothetical protein M0812_27141 [Anaeramoeba flamelloides]